jgi:PAS domain S-box-containing protein
MPTEPGVPDAEALRASEARMSAILRTSLDCIITIDHAGLILDFNPAAEQTFGYTREEAIGREMAELIVPPSLQGAPSTRNRAGGRYGPGYDRRTPCRNRSHAQGRRGISRGIDDNADRD